MNDPSRRVNFEELDKLAWDAICQWPERSGIDPVHVGINFAHLSRFCLWDKVGRALRLKNLPALADSEMRAYNPPPPASTWPWTPRAEGARRTESPIDKSKSAAAGVLDALRLRDKSKTDIFLPFPHRRFSTLTRYLTARKNFNVVLSEKAISEYPGANSVSHRVPVRPIDEKWRAEFLAAMRSGLSGFGIEILESDLKLLERQLGECWSAVQMQEFLINHLRPKLVLLHTDNHPPYQAAALVARKFGVDAMMVQHGLDCERYYLDDAYASIVAAWGPRRAFAYKELSAFQPRIIKITGNPEFDGIQLATLNKDSSGDWLWLTRPHAPEKCYAPSRFPGEGLEIMAGLCQALKEAGHGQRLVIKPHPFDDFEAYKLVARDAGVTDQVEISTRDVHELLGQCGLVISEDSTAGMEAMMFGKILVHAHFTPSAPTAHFVEYGAALPGFSPGQLLQSIDEASNFSGSKLAEIAKNQQRFLSDYAGPLDGKSTERVIGLIEDVIREKQYLTGWKAG